MNIENVHYIKTIADFKITVLPSCNHAQNSFHAKFLTHILLCGIIALETRRNHHSYTLTLFYYAIYRSLY